MYALVLNEILEVYDCHFEERASSVWFLVYLSLLWICGKLVSPPVRRYLGSLMDHNC